jgi:hypothetical protein
MQPSTEPAAKTDPPVHKGMCYETDNKEIALTFHTNFYYLRVYLEVKKND